VSSGAQTALFFMVFDSRFALNSGERRTVVLKKAPEKARFFAESAGANLRVHPVP
jgi:hypothetical protein